jgi:hypothetical protein
MLPIRRQAKLAAVDGLMKMLGNMDSERMQKMSVDKQYEDGSEPGDLEGSAQLANKNDAHGVLQAKGSDSDIDENTLNQAKAAPPNQDPTDGDPDGHDLAEEDDGMRGLRDAAERGDSTSRRIMELFADEPENDEGQAVELEPSASDVTSSEPSEDEKYTREDEDADDQRGMETAPDEMDSDKDNTYTGERSGYIGGDVSRAVGDVGMSVKLPKRRR